MGKTRFMTVLFSASENGDEELTNQVAEDIQKAKENGSYEDESGEMSYKDLGDKGVLATDKENGEHTLIHENPIKVGDDVVIDLEEIPEYCVEDLVHPEVSENEGSMVYNPMDEKEFSVTTENSAVLKIFSDQELVETVSESVERTEQDAQVGDLKFEKDSDSDGIIVTDVTSGDKAKVELEGENMKVTELDQKNFKYYSNKEGMNVIRRKVFSHEEQYDPIFVVAIDPINKVLVNSPVYGEEAANDLAQKLSERGLIGVNIFENPDEGREYAMSLLCGEGATSVGDEQEMEVAYSDDTVIANRYFSDRTRFMNRLFSEAEDEVSDHQELIESAIEDGDQMETEDFIITPVNESTAVVEDKGNGEYTSAEIDGDEINVEEISEDQAMDMMKNIEVEDDDQREYADKVGVGKRVANWISNKGKSLKEWGEKGKTVKYKSPVFQNGKMVSDEVRTSTSGREMAKKVGEFVRTNPKKSAAIAAASTAGLGGLGVGGYKLAQKDNSELAQSEYADKVGAGKKAINWVSNKGKSLKEWGEKGKVVSYKGPKFENGKMVADEVKKSTAGREMAKKVGEFVRMNPKEATAITAATLAAAGTGAGVGVAKAMKKKDEKDYSDVDEATLAQIEDSSVNAIQNVQEAAETAIEAINEAKEAPVEEVKDIKEATYSEKTYSETEDRNPSLAEVW